MSNYSPPPFPNYLSSDWGQSQAKYTAMNIDHIADKARFAIDMLESVLKAFDVIEKEIVDASQSSVPPSREAIRAFAYRIDAQQQQLASGLQHLKQMMVEIDRVTDKIQAPKTDW